MPRKKKHNEIVPRFDDGLEYYRKDAIQAAKDLRYGSSVIKVIEQAETHGEIQRIMINARHEKFGIK